MSMSLKTLPSAFIILSVILLIHGCSGGGGGSTDDEVSASTNTDDEVPASTSTVLKGLTLSHGTLNPAFSSSQTNYSLSESEVPAETFITVTAVAKDENAEVTVSRSTVDGAEISAGSSPYSTEIATEEKIEVTVSSPDGSSVSIYTILFLPEDFPELYVSVSTEPSPGYFFINNFNNDVFNIGQYSDIGKFLIILDNLGIPIWYKRVDPAAPDFKVQPNGELSYVFMDTSDGVILDIIGTSHPVVTMNADFEQTGSYEAHMTPESEEVITDPHDSILTEDGSIFLIGWVGRVADLSEYGGDPEITKMDYVIQELDPDGNLVFSWESRTYFSLDDLDPAIFTLMENKFDFTHLNSIDIDHNDGNLVASMRYYSQVVKIALFDGEFNGVAYAKGDVIWRLGGTTGDFTFTNDPRQNGYDGFVGQHAARMLPNGNIMIFDNAFIQSIIATGAARYVEYELDTDLMTAKKVAEFSSNSYFMTEENEHRNYYSPIGGSVQKLADGHIVIGWGGKALYGDFPTPSLTEIDENLNTVFELSLEAGEFTYRAYKFTRNDDGSWNHGSLFD